MHRTVLPALFASVLAACGGGGGDAPASAQAAPQSAPAATSAAPAPQLVAVAVPGSSPGSTPPATPGPVVVATAAPAPPGASVPASSCTYTDLGGNSQPCDPRWPFRTIPPNGSTQDQVDGYNAMCQTMICIQTRCPDGQVLPFYVAYHVCPAPPPAAAAT